MMDISEFVNRDLISIWMPYWRPNLEELSKKLDKVVICENRNEIYPEDRNQKWLPSQITSKHSTFAFLYEAEHEIYFSSYTRKEFKGAKSENIWALHSFDGNPAFYSWEKNGYVVMTFAKMGIYFRDGGLPSQCYFDGEGHGDWEWTNEKGQWHRPQEEGPSTINVTQKTGARLSWMENNRAVRPTYRSPLYERIPHPFSSHLGPIYSTDLKLM